MSVREGACRTASAVRIAVAMATAATLSQADVGFAHIVLADDRAEVNSFKAISFWVAESCSGSPTTAFSVDVPASIEVAKPQSKAGWTVKLTKEPAAGTEVGNAQKIQRTVTRVAWQGGQIPDHEFDQFTLLIQTPSEAGPIYFPAVQACGEREIRWFGTPDEKNAKTGMSRPAPVLKVIQAKVGPASRH